MKDVPPTDAPEWEKPYNWEWFKHHHFAHLEKCHLAIENFYEKLPLGKALSNANIKIFLDILDELIELKDWLPSSEGGIGTMEKIIKARKEYEEAFLKKEENTLSFWQAQELQAKVDELYNYMDIFCNE